MDDLFSVKGRVALVTGAGSGFGEQFCKVLSLYGAAIVAVGRRLDKVEAVAEAVRKAGGKAIALSADVTDAASLKAAFDAAEKAFGTVDIVVANAGVASVGKSVDVALAEFRAVMATNVDGVLLTAQEAARRLMAAKKPGSIVVTASIAAFAASRNLAAYNASKAAVLHLAKTLASEWVQYQIRVNALCPGYFVTDLNRDALLSEKGAKLRDTIPMRRFGQDGELDGALMLLASNAGSFITGHGLVVDGGHLLNVGS